MIVSDFARFTKNDTIKDFMKFYRKSGILITFDYNMPLLVLTGKEL